MKSKKLSESILKSIRSEGFKYVDLDTVIETNHIVERSGESFRRFIFSFNDQKGNEICLRPDLTIASCLKYLHEKNKVAKKVFYSGQAFRKTQKISRTIKRKSETLYIKNKLKKLGIKYKIDNSNKSTGSNHGNIIAKLGNKKNVPTILLSSHMDTVTNGIGIKPKVTKTSVTSDGTTILGADDKSGLSIILETLEVLKTKKIKHYNIEAAITTCEEIGLLGAKHLDYSLINAKEGIVLDSTSPERLVYKGPSSDYFTIEIVGVEAHSGINPDKGISSIVASSELISKMKTGRINSRTTINIGKIRCQSGLNQSLIHI